MEKNCLHEDDVGKKMFAETCMFKKNVCGDICLKKMFTETYMLKKNVCERTFLIHPLQKKNGSSLIITHTY